MLAFTHSYALLLRASLSFFQVVPWFPGTTLKAIHFLDWFSSHSFNSGDIRHPSNKFSFCFSWSEFVFVASQQKNIEVKTKHYYRKHRNKLFVCMYTGLEEKSPTFHPNHMNFIFALFLLNLWTYVFMSYIVVIVVYVIGWIMSPIQMLKS